MEESEDGHADGRDPETYGGADLADHRGRDALAKGVIGEEAYREAENPHGYVGQGRYAGALKSKQGWALEEKTRRLGSIVTWEVSKPRMYLT